jgi:hypothetical protein
LLLAQHVRDPLRLNVCREHPSGDRAAGRQGELGAVQDDARSSVWIHGVNCRACVLCGKPSVMLGASRGVQRMYNPLACGAAKACRIGA